MANTVPVLQIPVDDSQWQAFLATFAKFKIDAAEIPESMAEIERAIERLPEHLRPASEALEEAAEAAADALEDSGTAGGGGEGGGPGGSKSKSRKRRGGSRRKTEPAVALDWVLAATGARRFASTITGATRDLARWEKLTVVFSGLLGVGGLYGVNALAAGAANRRREASGLGVSSGELASFQTNYARLGDTSGILAGLSGAETDVTKRQPLQSLGIDPRGKNSLQLFGEMLPKLKNIADHADPKLFAATIRPYNLDQLGIDERTMRLIRALPADEIPKMVADARRDAQTLGVPDDVGRKWQDLVTTLHKAETRLQTALADDLVALTPGLTHLSETAVGLIDHLLARQDLKDWLARTNKALLWFADEVGSDDARTKTRDFLRHFEMAKSDFDSVNAWLDRNGNTLLRIAGAIVGARVGGVLGLPGAAAGAVLGATGMLPTHIEGQRGYRPEDHGAQYGGGAAAERPTLAKRNLERKGLGLPEYKDQETYDRAEPPVTAPSPPAGSGSVDKDISGDISGRATYARQNEVVADPQAFIVHHTGGGGTAEGVVNTLNQRGLGVQYVLDRDGHIFRTLPEGHRGAHILDGNVDGKRLSNANTLGMEVIAKDDSDITPAQVEAARKFYADLHRKYPHIEAYGHGYVNPGHKMASEGLTITNAIRADERAATQGPARDGVKAAGEAAAGVPVAKRGFMTAYAGQDVPKEMQSRADYRRVVNSYLSGHPYARPKPPQTVVVTDNSGGSSTVTVAH